MAKMYIIQLLKCSFKKAKLQLKIVQNVDKIDGVSTKTLNYYKDKTLGVDLSILLHRSIYNNSNYISYFINFVLKLNKYDINPIFIFV